MGKRILPTVTRKTTELIWWAETKEGCTIYREENKVGGARYWSDEIGGGVIVWDTCLVSPETLRQVLELEKVAGPSDRGAAAAMLRAEIYESIEGQVNQDGEMNITLDIGDAINHMSTSLLHKIICDRETMDEPMSESELKFPIEEYQELYAKIEPRLGQERLDGAQRDYDDAELYLILDALKHAAGERLAEAQIKHMRRIGQQACQDLADIEASLTHIVRELRPRIYDMSNDSLFDALKALEMKFGEIDDVRRLFEHMNDPVMGHHAGTVTRYEREALIRRVTEAEERARGHAIENSTLLHANHGLAERLATRKDMPQLSIDEIMRSCGDEKDPDVLRAWVTSLQKELGEARCAIETLGAQVPDPRPFLED